MSSKVTKLVVLGATAAATTYVVVKNDRAKTVAGKVKNRATDPNGLVQKGKVRVASAASDLASAGKARLSRDNVTSTVSSVSTPVTPAATDDLPTPGTL
jgi:hypothetical protein